MKRSNPAVYPITFAFEQFLMKEGILTSFADEIKYKSPDPKERNPQKMANAIALALTAGKMHESLGEYEHGLASELQEMYEKMDIIFTANANLDEDDQELHKRRSALNILRKTYEDLLLMMINS